jgi:transcription elongation factor Elf1
MIQLETYKGTRTRHTCPACNSKNQFTRFVDDAGNYLADDVGICNRVSKCGYRYTAKQYYADNPQAKNGQFKKGKRKSVSNYHIANLQLETPSFDFIAPEHLKATLSHYDRNAFVQFLFDLFPDCSEEIQSVLKMYLVGTYDDYTCFPQIDRQMRVCKAKLIRFNRATGKRLKGDFDTSSLVRKLKLKEDFNYKQIFFGEHLLSNTFDKPICIVEAEKTAIIASLCFPEFIWLGCNSKTWLKAERLKRFGQRQIVLYPDADGFELWQSIAKDAQRQGSTIKVSNLIENHATAEQKANGYDLADYLINQQNEINELNEVYDAYNSKVDLVLNDETLFNGFKLFLEEQKAIAIYNGLTDTQAERICTQPENLRSVALSV